MANCLTEMEMTRLVDGVVHDNERLRFEEHLAECQTCRGVCANLSALRQAGQEGRLPTLSELEVETALRRLAEAGAQLGDTSPPVSLNRLSAFFAGLIDAESVVHLLLESPILAGTGHGVLGRVDAHQTAQALCALRCEATILRSAGIELDDDALLTEAVASGWFVPGAGTPLAYLGRLLSQHGLQIERYFHADVTVLRHALDAGYKLVVAVDAGELGEEGRLTRWLERMEDFVAQIPDHCVLVTDVVSREGERAVVVAHPAAPFRRVTIAETTFLDAWEDSAFFLLAVKTPAYGKAE